MRIFHVTYEGLNNEKKTKKVSFLVNGWSSADKKAEKSVPAGMRLLRIETTSGKW